MRICIVCDDIFPSLGGKGRVAERYAKKLADRGHDVIILAGKYKNKSGFSKNGKIRVYRFSGIPLPKNDYKFFMGAPSPYKIYSLLKNHRIDVVNVYSCTYLTFISILVAKRLNIPVMISSHSQPKKLIKNIGINASLNKIIEKSYQKFIVKMCNISDAVQVPSRFAHKQLISWGFKKKVVIISNGVDLKFFYPAVKCSVFIKRFHLENKKIVLYVGRLMKEKNVKVLIKSFSIASKKLENAVLIIVGEGFLKKELMQLAYSLGISEKVTFTGRIPEKDLNMPFAAADLFVMPSLVELQGLAVLEAMASGKPILVAKSEDSAAAELVVEGKNGYTFNPKNEHELSSKIIKLLENKNLRLRMGKCSLSYAKNHDIDKSVDKMEALYKSLLKE